MSDPLVSRRVFVASGVAAGIGIFLGAVPFRGDPHCAHRAGGVDHGPHPTPRPGIDASHVLKADQLKASPDAISAFDQVRQIPEIVDGIRCHCGCAKETGFYSLLSCYEGEGMARDCHICQGQGRMAFRMHSAGKSLAQIRDAIDAKYD
jgi:hypothetical protein